jgi:hypothetical protein
MKNQRMSSGRIVVPGSDNIGRFVSPKEEDFLKNIEQGVFDLVVACLSRGFVTVSSCEGHPEDFDNREVTLAFRSKIEIEKFKPLVNDFRTTITDKFFGSESNYSLYFSYGENYTHFITIWIDPPNVEDKTKELENRILGYL